LETNFFNAMIVSTLGLPGPAIYRRPMAKLASESTQQACAPCYEPPSPGSQGIMPKFVIAHLSDPHLGPLEGFTPAHWNLKRALGWINWQRNRWDVHLTSVANQLVADLKQQQPDHIAVGGDLVNIGLSAEYIRAQAWMEALGTPDRVSLVPGNHDIYTTLPAGEPGVERWRPYMTSEAAVPGAVNGFPYVRRFGDVALVGLNSSEPTRPAVATGRLGTAQIEAAGGLLRQLAYEDVFRFVMIHHPPLPGQAKDRRELLDAGPFSAMLAQAGAELVVHGHNHRTMQARHQTAGTAAIPVIGVASASVAKPHKSDDLARYHLFAIERHANGWRIEMTSRGLAVPGGPVIELARQVL
jgi:3',5'-cyclic AMP phosphodiesterase CpdA